MALPGKLGASIAADMGKSGLGSAAAPMAEDSSPAPAADDGGIDSILSEIDDKFPGLGDLLHELVDRMIEEDKDSDAADMG